MPTTSARLEAAAGRGSWASVLSWKALVLAGTVGLAFTLLLPSVRVYLDQRAELADLRSERDAAQAEVDHLNAELARWDDPAFVMAQARERLAYAFPGETPYRVVDPEFARPVAPGTTADEAAADQGVADEAWFDTLWGSIEAAGAEPTAPSPALETTPEETQAPQQSVELGG